jgi:SAM-dependent methyltransferase/glycosyltransferase involved in cell wall biosynthesis
MTDARTDYYGRANPDLLEKIPVTARTVLDIGCGMGALGVAFLRRQPRARYYGIEMDDEAAAVARGRLAAVAQGDIEREWNPHGLAAGSVDALVFGDVLEHLRDPWATLANLATLLCEGGVLVACIPNIGHWTILAGLAAGRFDYADSGLLDRTHLRFFTFSSMVEMLRRAGLAPVTVRPRLVKNHGVRAFLAAAEPLAKHLGIAPDVLQSNLTAFQYVVTATKGASPMPMKLSQIMLAPGFMDVRTVEPGSLLASLPGVAVSDASRGVAVRSANENVAEVALIHRLIPKDPEATLNDIARLVSLGHVVVADWDDHPSLFQDDLRALAEEHIPPVLRACHAVQTSTETLAAMCREINPEVGVHGNHLHVLPDEMARPESPVKVFFGAFNRENDWAPYVDVLNRVLNARPGARLVVVHDRGLYDRVTTVNKEFSPALPRERYLEALHGCHVAWLPLADNAMTRCKSDIKAVEAGAGAVAILAEETVYAKSLRHDETGWLYRDAAGFEAGLARLLDEASLRKRLGAAARAWVVAERMAAFHIEKRREWYLDLWSRREALTAALFRRSPEMKDRVAALDRQK